MSRNRNNQNSTPKSNPKTTAVVKKKVISSGMIRIINRRARKYNGIRHNEIVTIETSQFPQYEEAGFEIFGQARPVIEEDETVVVAEPTLEEMTAKLIERGFEKEELDGKDLEELKNLYIEQKKEVEPNLDEME